jgi:hypothetical protein
MHVNDIPADIPFTELNKVHEDIVVRVDRIDTFKSWFIHQAKTLNVANTILLVTMLIISLDIKDTLQSQRDENNETRQLILEVTKINKQVKIDMSIMTQNITEVNDKINEFTSVIDDLRRFGTIDNVNQIDVNNKIFSQNVNNNLSNYYSQMNDNLLLLELSLNNKLKSITNSSGILFETISSQLSTVNNTIYQSVMSLNVTIMSLMNYQLSIKMRFIFSPITNLMTTFSNPYNIKFITQTWDRGWRSMHFSYVGLPDTSLIICSSQPNYLVISSDFNGFLYNYIIYSNELVITHTTLDLGCTLDYQNVACTSESCALGKCPERVQFECLII